ncbi:phage portal protein [Nissabacter sp. SGAir0207]|uniref:phage portal protein n=1 Tax=Nissabacter sp. SGAir0207 TaxID=2126321 RepID=UPI0010CD326C|nr:phage portal protein [Nissabacter sp. SGAir0207]QCR38954.1 phage portal protein [Nissabacter sp. SGAir0207]
MPPNDVRILGADGEPLPPSRPQPYGLHGSGRVPFDAADSFSDQLADWQPQLWSPDNEINIYRDRVVSRVRDMTRNDGWASGAITRILDNAVGAIYRPIFKPDYRYLQLLTGNTAFDANWADEYARYMNAQWRTWANDEGRWCDIERKKTVSQMLRLALRHKLVDGDSLAVMHYDLSRLGAGRATFATAVQIVDPDRLSNPQQVYDMAHIRGGVEIDDYGAPVAYHIREAHMGDWWDGKKTMTWQRIPRETPWGRPIVIHDFDSERAAQHRGSSIFTPVVQRMKMLIKYDQTELESAILNAMFGAFLQSPYDPAMVEDAMGGAGPTGSESLGVYQDERFHFHKDNRTSLKGGSRIPILFPGETITTVNAARPYSNFSVFQDAFLRNITAATGLSTQQITQDWSSVNYSSARAAMLEAWKTLTRRRHEFAIGTAQPIATCFVEEVHSLGGVPLPAGAPDFLEARTAYSHAKWMGPGRGWVDPVAEKKGAILGLDAGLSTLSDEVGDGSGEDWEAVLEQRAIEKKKFDELGLNPPEWTGEVPASETIDDPEVT